MAELVTLQLFPKIFTPRRRLHIRNMCVGVPTGEMTSGPANSYNLDPMTVLPHSSLQLLQKMPSLVGRPSFALTTSACTKPMVIKEPWHI